MMNQPDAARKPRASRRPVDDGAARGGAYRQAGDAAQLKGRIPTVADSAAASASLVEAYAACERLASGHYENFPVASRLLPRAMRPHVAALYAFARVADDVADEGRRTPDERRLLLDDWLARLRGCVNGSGEPARGQPGGAAAAVDAGTPGGPSPEQVFKALGHTIRERRLPLAPFEDLLSAFRQDTTTVRYEDWAALLDYCRRSANPVGRLVLRIAGYANADLDRASDALCTALQLTNFWQDLERDWQKGRLYVPLDECRACEAQLADLDARHITPAWACALRRAAARTRDLFEAGRPVCDGVRGRLRWELRATWLGGLRILEKLERNGFDVFKARPSLGIGDVPVIASRMIRWRQRMRNEE
jgi:phytoene synthase